MGAAELELEGWRVRTEKEIAGFLAFINYLG